MTLRGTTWFLATLFSAFSLSAEVTLLTSSDTAATFRTNYNANMTFLSTNTIVDGLSIGDNLSLGSPETEFPAYRIQVQGLGYPHHIGTEDIPTEAAAGATNRATILLNAEDSQVVLYSSPEGDHGSTIVLGEFDSGDVTGSWVLSKATSSGTHEGKFYIRQYTDGNYAGNQEAPFVINTNNLVEIGSNATEQNSLLVHGESETDTLRVKARSHGSEFQVAAAYTGAVGANAVIEGQDGLVAIASTPQGTFGSRLDFIETVGISDATLVDQWSFMRETTAGGSDLNLYFNTDGTPAGETPLVSFHDDDIVDVNGRLIFDTETITALVEDTVPSAGDFFIIYDGTGSTGLRKVDIGNLTVAVSGVVADTEQTQGSGQLTSEVSEVATVANANDVVTLLPALPGRGQFVINNGANTLQIYPSLGDDLGAGVNTSTTLAAGSNVRFTAYDSTNWEIE